MIADFQDLSDKIDRLAQLAQTLRLENAQLRQSNATLAAENNECHRRLGEAHARVLALLEKIPADDAANEEAAP